tara:strand:+ start:708 stop:1100 length:393 start_codon:yes stop_codon:yes gene_type:complete
MNDDIKNIFKIAGLPFEELEDINGLVIERDILLNETKYESVKLKIPELKKYLSSSCLTSLQKDANKKQKWPLLNLVRQILKIYYFKMEPIRKSNGYTKEGKKLYKRLFLLKKIENTKINSDNLQKESENS